jgi:hypothetical protein
MGWIRLTNSTTADADEVHGNFIEVRSTDLLPMKLSSTASKTASAYDVGSTAYPWRNVFAGKVISKSHYVLMTTTSLDAIGTTTVALVNSMDYTLWRDFRAVFWARIWRDTTTSIWKAGLIIGSQTAADNYTWFHGFNPASGISSVTANGLNTISCLFVGETATAIFSTKTYLEAMIEMRIERVEAGILMRADGELLSNQAPSIGTMLISGSNFVNQSFSSIDFYIRSGLSISTGRVDIYGAPNTLTAIS